ncbi:MAG TPA: transposase [Leucothrix sp.]|nr:transposase [Leucothrix sp.]
MFEKNIKKQVNKQLKKNFPNWQKLQKKEKKKIASEALEVAVADYDFSQPTQTNDKSLFGVEEQAPAKGMMTIKEMAQYIKDHNSYNIFRLCDAKRVAGNVTNEELRFIDKMLDNTVLTGLLASDSYSPQMREYYPVQFFRAELLKAIKYPEISYRKYCTEEYLGLDRKENREFIGLPLHKKTIIDHTQLCQFRNNITFVQQVNLMVYILHHFHQSGRLGDCLLHGIDSTELANDCNYPLATITIKGKKIRIYNDIDCDCGKRRNKRDKSRYVVGYRLHTLTAIDAITGHSFPLISLLAPANHHDSNFLSFLVELSQCIGIDVKIISADEAYHDNDGSLYQNTGVLVSTPPSPTVKLPEHVNSETGAVFIDDECTIPMARIGYADQMHEYKCAAQNGECDKQDTCPLYRDIPVDRGYFQQIPYATENIKEVHDIRKNIERPFNLIKNQVGMEQVRVRSQHATLTRCTISNIAVLLIEMAGKRRKKKKHKSQQLKLPKAA